MTTKEPIYAICPACRGEFEIVRGRGRKIPVHDGGGFDDCAGSGRPAVEGIALHVKAMVESARRTIEGTEDLRERLRRSFERDMAAIDEDVARAEAYLAKHGGRRHDRSTPRGDPLGRDLRHARRSRGRLVATMSETVFDVLSRMSADRVVVSVPKHGKAAAYRAIRDALQRGAVALPRPTARELPTGTFSSPISAPPVLTVETLERTAQALREPSSGPRVVLSTPWQDDQDSPIARAFANVELRSQRIRRQALERTGRTGRILVSWLIGRWLR